MKITMLTADTLTRLAKLVDPSTLTAEQTTEIEHDAYCANMGADSQESAWNHFKTLCAKYAGIDLDALEAEKEATAIYDRMTAELEARTDRSAWNRGVNVYALELVEALKEAADYNKRNPEPGAECKAWLLNGAQNWEQFSYGGSALIYDGDIAERLCTPSELKKTRDGERNPNGRETWLDVQARALFQACNRVTRLYSRIVKEG